MLIVRVIGTTVSTIKDEKLQGKKLLIVQPADEAGKTSGKPFVAIDTVDAGVGDLVLTASGSSARQTTITKDTPVDAVIMAVIDSLEVNGEVTFRNTPWTGPSSPVWPTTASSMASPIIVATHHVYREKISMIHPGGAPPMLAPAASRRQL